MSVQAALDYKVPENACSKPEVVAGGASVSPPIQDASSVSIFEGSSTASVSDVDSYERERQERKESRWNNCLAEYKKGLLNDMERLKGSAQHGLTQEQAHAIVANMALVQSVYLSPDGVLESEEGDSEIPEKE